LSNILNNTGTPQTSINATPIPCATHTGLNPGENCSYKETCTGTFNQYTNTYGSGNFKEYHFCSADETSNRFLRPDANWGAMFNRSGYTITGSDTNSATTVGSGFYGASNFNWSDTTNNPKVNVFSANYLNWKFGAKRNGNPIGRKTRLQIAKDTLNDFISASSNGMRIGLMIFNDMPTDPTTQVAKGSPGAHIAFAVQRMGTNNTNDAAYGTAANTLYQK
jgi:hypothetical protein